MEHKVNERFYDCVSEGEEELNTVDHTDCRNKYLPSYPDKSKQVFDVFERAADNVQLLLKGLGVHSADDGAPTQQKQQRSCQRFYPATLEISARLNTDASCKLRGDPVTLKLPMELDPHDGQVNVNIFQPNPAVKPLAGVRGEVNGAGDRYACSCLNPSISKKPAQRREGDRKCKLRVRWPDA